MKGQALGGHAYNQVEPAFTLANHHNVRPKGGFRFDRFMPLAKIHVSWTFMEETFELLGIALPGLPEIHAACPI